jgi:hypothetical protein
MVKRPPFSSANDETVEVSAPGDTPMERFRATTKGLLKVPLNDVRRAEEAERRIRAAKKDAGRQPKAKPK